MNKPLRIINVGAGVQSSTICLMAFKNWEYWSCSERLPYPSVGLVDCGIFADTQDEPQVVYDHLQWMIAKVGKFFPIHIRSKGSLGNNLVKGVNSDGKRSVSIPAFTADAQGNNQGITRRQCTQEYKIEVIENFIRRELLEISRGARAPKDTMVEQIFGLSYDEAGRIIRVKANIPWWSNPIFPLFDMEMTRGGCVNWLKKQDIPHTVPRSACVYCPYRKNSEWRKMKEEDPVSWARAVEIDEAIRDRDSVSQKKHTQPLYIHRSCTPLSTADLDDPETREGKKGQEMFSFLTECVGLCGN